MHKYWQKVIRAGPLSLSLKRLGQKIWPAETNTVDSNNNMQADGMQECENSDNHEKCFSWVTHMKHVPNLTHAMLSEDGWSYCDAEEGLRSIVVGRQRQQRMHAVERDAIGWRAIRSP